MSQRTAVGRYNMAGQGGDGRNPGAVESEDCCVPALEAASSRKNTVKRRKEGIINLSGRLHGILKDKRSSAASPRLQRWMLFHDSIKESERGAHADVFISLGNPSRHVPDLQIQFQLSPGFLLHPKIPKLSPNHFSIVQSLK